MSNIPAPKGLSVATYTTNTVVLNWYDADTYDKVLLAWGLGINESDPMASQIDLSSSSAIVASFSVNSYTINNIDTTPGRSYVFKVKGGSKSDVLGAGITWDYSDWDTIVWRVPESGSFGESTGPISVGPTVVIAVASGGTVKGQHTGDGSLLWYEHLGANDGTIQWKNKSTPLGYIGLCKNVFPGGQGIIYTVTNDGMLHWYRVLGTADGTPGLVGSPDPKGHIGEGWGYKQVFSGGNGIIYAVNDNMNLLWYKHLGFADGTDRWLTTPEEKGYVGEGWNFKHVFSGGDGIIYAIDSNGNLLWYKHLGFVDGTDKWLTTPEKKGYIGEGWNFKQVFSAGNGVIYAVTDAGKLLWYRHLGYADGTDKWQTMPDPIQYVGEGWDFQFVFANTPPAAVIK